MSSSFSITFLVFSICLSICSVLNWIDLLSIGILTSTTLLLMALPLPGRIVIYACFLLSTLNICTTAESSFPVCKVSTSSKLIVSVLPPTVGSLVNTCFTVILLDVIESTIQLKSLLASSFPPITRLPALRVFSSLLTLNVTVGCSCKFMPLTDLRITFTFSSSR